MQTASTGLILPQAGLTLAASESGGLPVVEGEGAAQGFDQVFLDGVAVPLTPAPVEAAANLGWGKPAATVLSELVVAPKIPPVQMVAPQVAVLTSVAEPVVEDLALVPEEGVDVPVPEGENVEVDQAPAPQPELAPSPAVAMVPQVALPQTPETKAAPVAESPAEPTPDKVAPAPVLRIEGPRGPLPNRPSNTTPLSPPAPIAEPVFAKTNDMGPAPVQTRPDPSIPIKGASAGEPMPQGAVTVDPDAPQPVAFRPLPETQEAVVAATTATRPLPSAIPVMTDRAASAIPVQPPEVAAKPTEAPVASAPVPTGAKPAEMPPFPAQVAPLAAISAAPAVPGEPSKRVAPSRGEAPLKAVAQAQVGEKPAPAERRAGPILGGPVKDIVAPRATAETAPAQSDARTKTKDAPPAGDVTTAVVGTPARDVAPTPITASSGAPEIAQAPTATSEMMPVPAPTGQTAPIDAARPAPMMPVSQQPAPVFVDIREVMPQLRPVLHARQSGSMDLQLSPDELGALNLRIETPSDTSIVVHVQAERPEVMESLRQHRAELTQELRQAGFQSVDLRFADGGGARDQTPRQNQPPASGKFDGDPADVRPDSPWKRQDIALRPKTMAGGGIDIRL